VATIEGEQVKLWQSQVVTIDTNCQQGEIVQADKNSLIIQCNNSQLQINSIQRSGKKRMHIKQFMQSKSQWYK
jgi:methionyl-tRNA formyltransferase